MDKFTLTNKYSYIALNNIEVISKSFKLIETYISIGLVLDLVNNGVIVENEGLYTLNNDEELSQLEKNIVDELKVSEKELTFEELVSNSRNIKPNVREKFVLEIINNSMSKGDIDIIKSLLSLDVNYETSGLEIKEYRTSYEVFKKTIDDIKNSTETNEYYCLLWLLMQSGDITKVFNYNEIEIIWKKFEEFQGKSHLVVKLGEETHIQPLLLEWKQMLEAKNTLFRKGFGLGLVSRFPALERKEAVFIATEKMFANAQESLKTVVGKLVDDGHMVTVVRDGQVPVLDIDNVLYEIVPDAIRVSFVNVHGVRLRRYVLE